MVKNENKINSCFHFFSYKFNRFKRLNISKKAIIARFSIDIQFNTIIKTNKNSTGIDSKKKLFRFKK